MLEGSKVCKVVVVACGVKACIMIICIDDKIRCKDGVEGKVVDFHKYRKDYHIVIKTDKGEERELNLSEYCKSWVQLL
jgi:hypothetical protein